mmetsp:Transcript_16152/g.34975  ORF Transcript_16152/g.34975 Transcript_16152/m.34975 type:complete len:81 (-) Transcript_16152:485-727(-)
MTYMAAVTWSDDLHGSCVAQRGGAGSAMMHLCSTPFGVCAAAGHASAAQLKAVDPGERHLSIGGCMATKLSLVLFGHLVG